MPVLLVLNWSWQSSNTAKKYFEVFFLLISSFFSGNHEKCFPYFFAELNLPATFGKLYTVTVKENYDPDPTGTIVHKLLHIEVL